MINKLKQDFQKTNLTYFIVFIPFFIIFILAVVVPDSCSNKAKSYEWSSQYIIKIKEMADAPQYYRLMDGNDIIEVSARPYDVDNDKKYSYGVSSGDKVVMIFKSNQHIIREKIIETEFIQNFTLLPVDTIANHAWASYSQQYLPVGGFQLNHWESTTEVPSPAWHVTLAVKVKGKQTFKLDDGSKVKTICFELTFDPLDSNHKPTRLKEWWSHEEGLISFEMPRNMVYTLISKNHK